MKRFFKDFIIYGFASVMGKIVAVFLMPIYTNILTQQEYGTQALLLAFGGFFDVFANLNIHSGVARDYFEKDIDRAKMISTGFYSVIFQSTVVALTLLLLNRYIVDVFLGLQGNRMSYAVMVATIPFTSLSAYFSVMTRYLKRPILFTIGTLIRICIQVSISIIGIVLLRVGIISIFLGIFFGELFCFMFYAYVNRAYIIRVYRKDYIKRVLIFSVPTLPGILAGWLDGYLGQLLIGKYISTASLGIYSIALQLSSGFLIIGTALQNVWYPYLYENCMRQGFDGEFRKLYLFFILLLSGVCFVLTLFSDNIILLLSNSSYIIAATYLPILCISMSLYVMFPIVSSGLCVKRQTKYLGLAHTAGSIVNVLMLCLFISTLGVIAVPFALLSSRLTIYFILYYKGSDIFKIPVYSVILLVLVVFITMGIQSVVEDLLIKFVIGVSILSVCVLFSRKQLCIVKQMLVNRK